MSIKISKNRLDMGSTPIKAIDRLELDQIATPADPGTAKTSLYTKSDGKIYHLPTGGSETQIIDTDHSGASAAVHGLPANVSVQGNRDGAGRVLQSSAAGASITADTARSLYISASVTVTFAVAFSVTPAVVTGGTTTNAGTYGDCLTSTFANSSTSFRYYGYGTDGSGQKDNISWIALGVL